MSIPTELPGLYLDDVQTPAASAGVFVVNTNPEEDSVDAPADGSVQLDVISTVAAIVDKANTDVYVNGSLAVDGGVIQSGFDGPSAIVEMLALTGASQLLADADAEYKGSQLLTDGDMEAALGADLLTDGNAEYKGSQLLSDGDMENGPGSEEMTDGDMEAVGVAAWEVVNSATLTKESGSPGGSGSQVLRTAYNSVSYPATRQTVLTVARSYRLTGWARGDGSYSVYITDGVTVVWTGTSSSTWQAVDVIFRSTGTKLTLVSNATAAGWAEWDDVSVVETCPDWTPVYNALLTKESGTPGGSGSQVLRVAYTDTANPIAGQYVTPPGHMYRATGWARGDGSTGKPRLYVGGANVWTGTTSATWQQFDVTVNDVSGNGWVYLMNNATGGWAEFDDVVITEDCPDWDAGNSALLSKEGSAQEGSYCIRVTGGGAANPSAYQAVLTSGKFYRLTGYAKSDGTAIPRVLGGGTVFTGTTSTSWQAIDVPFKASATLLAFGQSAATGYTEWDALEVREDCADWDSTVGGVLSKESGSPGGGGGQVLRITNSGIGSAEQTVLTSGKTYRIIGWARGDAGTGYPIITDDGGGIMWVGTTSATWQAIDFSGVSAGTILTLVLGAAGWAEFDDIVVTEDCPDWTVVNDGYPSKQGSPHGGTYCLRVEGSGTANPAASQSVVVAGHGYRLTGWARGDGTNAPLVLENGTPVWTGITSTSWQQIDLIFSVTSTTVEFGLAASSGYVEFDDLALLEYHDLRVVLDPTTDLDGESLITVRVVSQTVGGTYTVDYTYSFTTEDISAPELLSAEATGPFTIRCTFNEGMLASSATGANDALNPDNYTFAYVPQSDRIAAVAVYADSVAQVSGAIYDVTVDMEPTFNKTYRVTCGDIADDSSNANELGANDRTADFTSWHPPYWPARRSFDLWSQLSQDDRDSDVEIGDLRRMISAMQDVVDILLWDIDAEQFYHDIDKAPEWAVDAMLADMGNPFALDLTLARKRKLLGVLIDIYQEKGTDEGIIDVARFFLGIEITSVIEINIDTWVLGESELGVDTDLGPSGTAELYTFWLNVGQTLTDQERRDLAAIVDYMKPAHTHYLIIEPTDPEFIDDWELGLSELGVSTYLH